MISMNLNDENGGGWWGAINGIGGKRAKWLEDEFDVNSIEEFVELSVNEIDSRVKSKNNIRWYRDEIEEAYEKARSLVNSPAGEDDWEYIAAYAVEFKARKVEGVEEVREINVRPVEITKTGQWGDVTDEKPAIVEGEQLYQWMQERVGMKSPMKPDALPQTEPKEEPSVEEQPPKAPSVTVEFTQVQVLQPPQIKTPIAIGEAGKPFRGFLRSDEPFDIQVSFNLAGQDVADITKKRISYSAQFYTRELPIGVRAVLGATEPDTLIKSQTSYTAKLNEVSLSSGIYRLRVLVRLLSTPPIGDYLEVPLLQVV